MSDRMKSVAQLIEALSKMLTENLDGVINREVRGWLETGALDIEDDYDDSGTLTVSFSTSSYMPAAPDDEEDVFSLYRHEKPLAELLESYLQGQIGHHPNARPGITLCDVELPEDWHEDVKRPIRTAQKLLRVLREP